MNKGVTTLIICTLLAICGVSGEELFFENRTWDFGTIEEEGGEVKHTFKVENRSEEPVVIHNIRTSCGCTTPTFSRKPIKAGASTTIEVSFDPRYQAGVVDKRVYIYSTSSDEPIELYMKGNVTPRKVPIEERYPYTIGSGGRIGATYITIAGLVSGEQVQSMVEYTNRSTRTIEVEFRPLTQRDRLTLYYDPIVKSGEAMQLNVAYCAEEAELQSGKRLRDTLEIYVNGELSTHRLYIMGIVRE